MYMSIHDPEPELELEPEPEPESEPEPEPYSDKMSESEPSSNFLVPQPCKKHRVVEYYWTFRGCGSLEIT
jgi:hypothetical protein